MLKHELVSNHATLSRLKYSFHFGHIAKRIDVIEGFAILCVTRYTKVHEPLDMTQTVINFTPHLNEDTFINNLTYLTQAIYEIYCTFRKDHSRQAKRHHKEGG